MVRVHPFVPAGLGMFSGSSPPPPKMQLPTHKVDSFWRSRPLQVFLTLEMPSSAPDSVILDTGRNREEQQNILTFTNPLYLKFANKKACLILRVKTVTYSYTLLYKRKPFYFHYSLCRQSVSHVVP